MIQLNVQSGFGFICFVGTLLTGLVKLLVSIGYWTALLGAAPVMALCICSLRALQRLGFSGIPISLGGLPVLSNLAGSFSAF